jgi:hypothetical protein
VQSPNVELGDMLHIFTIITIEPNSAADSQPNAIGKTRLCDDVPI